MSWIYLVLIAQLINALVVLWDKYLVTSKAEPVVYAFYVSILSGVVVVLLPFGVISIPDPLTLWLPVSIAFTFILSILLLYKALRTADASDVAPVAGAASAVSALFFDVIFLGGRLSNNFLIAFVLLVLGMALMSYFRFSKRVFLLTLCSGIIFGVSLVLTKIVFSFLSFVDGFFWSRIANVFGGVLLLAWPSNRRAIIKNVKNSPQGLKYAVIGNKTLAGLAFLLILLGVQMGNVGLVNALVGMQFVFILIFAVLFSKKFPKYFYEDVHNKGVVLQKILGVSFIVVGLVFMFL